MMVSHIDWISQPEQPPRPPADTVCLVVGASSGGDCISYVALEEV